MVFSQPRPPMYQAPEMMVSVYSKRKYQPKQKITKWGPLVTSWCIIPSKYDYNYHKPYSCCSYEPTQLSRGPHFVGLSRISFDSISSQCGDGSLLDHLFGAEHPYASHFGANSMGTKAFDSVHVYYLNHYKQVIRTILYHNFLVSIK